MPNIKSAKKKMRQDKKRQELNKAYKNRYKKAVKVLVSKPTKKQLIETVSLVDKAAKKGVIHKNKASRLKSRLSKIK
jgi:small subunit ribosomal protein S20